MNSRERVIESLNHRETEKLAIDFGGMGSTGISAIAYSKLKKYLGINGGTTRVYDTYQQLAEPEPELIDRLGGDVVQLYRYAPAFGIPADSWKPWKLPDGSDCMVPSSFNPELNEKGDLEIKQGDLVTARMPEGGLYFDFVHHYFGKDHIETIYIDSSPQYTYEVIEDTPEYFIYKGRWGTVEKMLKDEKSAMPLFMDYIGKTPEGWAKMKERMSYSEDRIPWDNLKANYKKWKENDIWIQAQIDFGFNVASAFYTGVDTFLFAISEDPDWCIDMVNHAVDLNLKLLDKLWDDGYRFDSVFWCDDMGFKGTTFFSVNTYREILKPAYKKAVNWAHKKGIKAHLHSCGNVMNFVPEFVDLGVDALNPLEIKAGMDPVKIKSQYGDKLLLHGGINAMLWKGIELIEEEIIKVLPVVMQKGGYIFSSDHSVPVDVSLENFS